VLKLGNCKLSWQVKTTTLTDEGQEHDTRSVTVNLKLMKEQNIVLQQRKSGWRLILRQTAPNQILYNPEETLGEDYPDEVILKLATHGPEIANGLKALVKTCRGGS
jgi:hypothetical protein